MKNKILLSLALIQIILLSLYFTDGNLKETNSVKTEMGKFKESDQLSEQSVNVISQDIDKHVWIGTDNGLNIYYGGDYKQLFFDSADSTTIPDNQIQSLLKDSKGNMWVGTPNGIARHIGCLKFQRYTIPFSPDGVYQLEDYGDKGILVNNGIDIYLIKNNTIEKFYHFNEFFERGSYVYADYNGGFWIVQPSQIRHFNSDKKETMPPVFSNANICNTSRRDNVLWINQSQMLLAIDLKKNDIIYRTKKELPIIPTQIFPKDNNTLLLNSSFHGLYSFEVVDGKLTKLEERDLHLRHKDVTISTFYGDRENNLWIGYKYGGFQIVSPNTAIYEQFNNQTLHDFTRNQPITRLDAVNDNIIGSTEDEVFCYNSEENELSHYMYNEIFSDSPFYRQTLEDIVSYNDEKFWIVSNVRILSCTFKHSKIKVLKRVFSRHHTGPLLGHAVKAGNQIIVASNSRYLLCSKFGSESCDSVRIDNKMYGKESLLQLLPDGKVLVITNGLDMVLYNPINKKIEYFPLRKFGNMNTATPNVVFMDSKQRIWIGTKHDGAFLFDYKDRTLNHVSRVPLDNIQSIQEGRDGKLWICSYEELISFNPKDSTLHFCSFPLVYNTNNHGLRYVNSCMPAKGNELILGTSRGCITIPLDYIKEEKKFNVGINSVQIDTHNGKKLGIMSSIKNRKHITLPYDENTLTIDFGNVNYENRERVMYQYKLEGSDDSWSKPSLQPSVRFNHLSPGTYKFKVRTVNPQNTNASSVCELTITIKPSLWMSSAALFFYVVCIVLAIYYVQLLYLKNQKDKLRIEQLQAERQRDKHNSELIRNFFANISHEFRNPLTLISGPLLMLREDKTLTLSARKSLNVISISVNRMLKLIDQILDFNKLETDALRLNVSKHDIVFLLQNITMLFSESTRIRGLDVVFEKDFSNLYAWIDSDKIEKIMSNLLTNALKHTPDKGQIKINLRIANNDDIKIFPELQSKMSCRYLRISVFNNGNHIEADKLQDIFKRYYQIKGAQSNHQYGWGTGLGLYYVKRLLSLHHGAIRVVNEAGGGVSFVFLIPFEKDAYPIDERAKNNDILSGVPTTPLFDETDKSVDDNQSKVNEIVKKPIILIVDDDLGVSQYIRSLFVDSFVVVNKYSAESALDEIENINPDIILSDVIMGDMNGYAFCRKLKSDLMTCHIPFVLITAKSNVSEQVEGLECGANAYVTKPFDPRYLKAVVNSMLCNIKMIKEKLSSGENPKVINENLSKQDRKFLDKLYNLMEQHISEQDISVSVISQELLISHSKLNYKLKELTGETPGNLFRKYKLSTAARLLREGKYNVSEVAYMTGFGTASHFSVAFKKQFGVSPSEYH